VDLAMVYEPRRIELKWQQLWQDKKAFKTALVHNRPKYYILDMFPYPSGHGLHVGHLKGYVASDIVARYKRMRGYNVLHPMGWDSFGLPTERQAEKDGMTPREVTRRNIKVFREQLDLVGLSYDWDREIATSDPTYYKWTQWIFLKLFERGLAYQTEAPVNWCPALRTVVANEEVKDGFYIETGDPVEQRVMRQWVLRITAYADRLLEDLDLVEWPEEVKNLQRNWIGRSIGTTITFHIQGSQKSFEVFTTRPETLYGCTFCVLAPEHPMVDELTLEDRRRHVHAYQDEVRRKPERERLAEAGTRTGVFTGSYTINPANERPIPIWISDYVLSRYGTGAVFACPAHDARDYDFAKRFGLEVIEVVAGGDIAETAFTGNGTMINSGSLNGLGVLAARQKIIDQLVAHGQARRTVNYNLRDWLFSRQRYWGEPIPLIHGPRGEIEPDFNLPLVLPDVVPGALGAERLVYPSAPLARVAEWINTTLPSTGEPAKRETNVMPQWAGSCWYYLRFIDPRNAVEFCDPALERGWMPVDLYIGGIEHANLHLLYARFWHKFLYDCGLVSTQEPFRRLFNQGKVHARSFRDKAGRYFYPEQVYERDGSWYLSGTSELLETRIEKMSKSRYNVVSPEPVVERYGADSLRLYEVFMGPLESEVIWQTDGLAGTRRFLDRVWRLFEQSCESTEGVDTDGLERSLHRTIRKVTEDLENLRLNTAVSQLMIFVNDGLQQGFISRDSLRALVRLLAPFAPHVAEEMWERLNNKEFVAYAEWPSYDEARCVEESVNVVVQVNGKVRANLVIARGMDERSVRELALSDESVRRWVDGKNVTKCVYIADKLISFAVA
jgi:leucyl-tRNA synthetase